LFSLFLPVQVSSSQSRDSLNGSVENLRNEMKIDCVNNFGEYKSSDDGDIHRMIGTSRPYSQREFNQSEYSKYENNIIHVNLFPNPI
jgi:hypothetical protein